MIKCVSFRNANVKLKFDLEEGMEVLVMGRIDLWDKGGSYQLILEDIRQAGKGDLFAKFEQLKAKLHKEGLFDSARKKQLPTFPSKIGLVTSPTGAVVRDIIHVIRRRYPYVELVLYPVKVQGEGSSQEIAQAIAELNKPQYQLDVMIVGRGGGSMEDLWSFNEERVARAIYASADPVVSAVGHQTDTTIADFVADVRAATPSQAAEMVTPNVSDLRERMDMLFKNTLRELNLKKENLQHRLSRLTSSQVLRDPRYIIQSRAQTLDYLVEKIEVLMKQKKLSLHERIQKSQLKLKLILQQFVRPRKMAFERQASNLSMLNPLSILNRGYGVAKNSTGKILTNATQVATGDTVHVKLYEGELACKVTQILK